MTMSLEDKRIVNTRAVHQAAALDELLAGLGAIPVPYPCIEIAPVEDTTALDQSLRDLAAGGYPWLALTSANSVHAISRRLDQLGLTLARAPFRTASIGPATAECARRMLGLESVVVPEEFVAESLGESLPVSPGERVLIPESAIARAALANILKARGARVSVVPAYRTIPGRGGDDVPRLVAEGRIDAISFTSSSCVTNFVQRMSREGGRMEDARRVCAACIGPITADAARDHGFETVVMPAEYTLKGLTEALADYFDNVQFTGDDDHAWNEREKPEGNRRPV